jgi:hypothetical protein
MCVWHVKNYISDSRMGERLRELDPPPSGFPICQRCTIRRRSEVDPQYSAVHLHMRIHIRSKPKRDSDALSEKFGSSRLLSPEKIPLVAYVTDVITQSKSDSSEQKAGSLPDSVDRGFDDTLVSIYPNSRKTPNHAALVCVLASDVYVYACNYAVKTWCPRTKAMRFSEPPRSTPSWDTSFRCIALPCPYSCF